MCHLEQDDMGTQPQLYCPDTNEKLGGESGPHLSQLVSSGHSNKISIMTVFKSKNIEPFYRSRGQLQQAW